MGGGLLQLIVKSQHDAFLTENPNISFFKYSYKKHTNFSMESLQLTFNTNPVLSHKPLSNTYQIKISRYGDLLSNLYFCYTLPDIYSSDKYKFKWIKNAGNLFIKKATISLDGSIIDTITGEWLNVWNELSLPKSETKYNDMIGNVADMLEPSLSKTTISIVNNKFIYKYYPESSFDNTIPSIKARNIVVPLNFFFTKNPSLALPLLRLQYKEIFINIEVESAEKLYQVYSTELGNYISPLYYNELYNDTIDIRTFTKSLIINPYIEANYIFLDERERNFLFVKASISYIIEQLDITSSQRFLSTTNASITINLNIHKPTKEIIWTIKRDDIHKYNDFNNYSASIPENNINGILDKASILWNRTINRIEEKEAVYFNMIQPYQHHTNIPKQGIYCYSFSLFPEKETPTGSYNASTIETSLLLYLKNQYNNTEINTKLLSFGKSEYEFDYLIDVYTLSYNVLQIIGGNAGLKFA